MRLSYEALISGDLIPMEGIGHLRPPKLRDLNPTEGIGQWWYGLYLSVLSWDTDGFISFVKLQKKLNEETVSKLKQLEPYCVAVIFPGTIELLRQAMAFFMLEKPQWDSKENCFIVCDSEERLVGKIDKDNFESVRAAMLQLNYIDSKNTNEPVSHSSLKSKQLWERAQEYLKRQQRNAVEDKSKNIGNIISKICASGVGYTLLNIYDLTVFQLYDQFFQIGYLRAMKINDMAYSNHGGDRFDMQAWEKPIYKL